MSVLDNLRSSKSKKPLVFTIPDRCRTCYTCVRECPAKAIKIENGQAEVIQTRCIACGNCIRVCSREAKWFMDNKEKIMSWINNGEKVIALVAPSFPGEFMDLDDHKQVVAMIKALGFKYIHEVAFGADLVAIEYKKLLVNESNKRYISSDCPAIVSFILKYYPDLIRNLAPIVSPMVAMARVVKSIYGEDIKVVFIGPCVAKKGESEEVDSAITFRELRELFEIKGITKSTQEEEEFSDPVGGMGSIFPVSRGLIQTIGGDDTIHSGKVVVAEGNNNFQEAIMEFEGGHLKKEHLELLCCDGCIMGAGMTFTGNRFAKSAFISNYVKYKIEMIDKEKWQNYIDKYSKIDLTAKFKVDDSRMNVPTKEEVESMLSKMGKHFASDRLNCGACGYDSCEEHAIAIINGIAEVEMCLPETIEKLKTTVDKLNSTNDKLASAQQALRQSEKLATMGQLSAGIAHELNNPLGVVMMYSNILMDELGEDHPLVEDIKLIVDQADRCKKIVGGLLNFARKNQVRPEPINLKTFSINSLQSVVIPETVETSVICDINNPIVTFDAEQMMQVFTNIIKNGIEAMPKGGKITIKIAEDEDFYDVYISDTGTGISKEHMDKIYEPFFTTKGVGQGTGLGLATSYGIIKMHKGKINIKTNTDSAKGQTGTTFIISIPKESKLEI